VAIAATFGGYLDRLVDGLGKSIKPAWIPAPTAATASILSDLLRSSGATGNLVSGAALAAIAIEHSIPVITNDSDFHRFPVTIVNPFE